MFLSYRNQAIELLCLNPFHDTVHFPYPLKTSENLYFSEISGGMERDQWHKIIVSSPHRDQGGIIFVSSARQGGGQLLNFKSQGGDTLRGGR